MIIENKIEQGRSDIILKVTVPLFNFKKNFKGLVGSGILFETNGKVFLITANHVMKNWGEYLFIPTEQGKQFSPSGRLFSLSLKHTLSGSEEDSIDTTVIELKAPDELRSYYQITNSSLFQLDTIEGEQYQYAVAGYPVSQAKVDTNLRTVMPTPCIYYTREYGDNAYDGIKYWKESHIAVNFQKETIYSKTGAKAITPSFKGVSGGGLWIIKLADEPNNETYKIYGINIEADVYKSIFYGTRIKLILDWIARQYNFETL
jgi:hypothetical protein